MNTKYALMAATLLSVSLPSCSDGEPVSEPSQTPVTPNEPNGIPQEVVDKVHEIYGKASIDPQRITDVHTLAILTSICATLDGGPISVTPAALNGEEVTLVTLGGTEDEEGQATTMVENQLASFGKPNDYLTALTGLFTDGTIPKEKPVIVTGISLGGMIAQQILGVDEVMKSHEIRAVITFGSPITLPLDRKGVRVVRFADTHDRVPELGEMFLRSGMVTGEDYTLDELKALLAELDRAERIARTSKYTEMIETHALSYIEDPCWSDVDFMGDPAGRNVLETHERLKYYNAPKLH